MTSFGGDEPGADEWGIRIEADGRWLAFGDRPLVASARLPVAGIHNELNVLAAMALARALGAGLESMAAAAASFEGLPHRCQKVAERAGVTYINDSKATNVGATLAALAGLGAGHADAEPHIILIAGGDGKDADFSPLADAVGRFVKALVLIGRDAPLLKQALADQAESHDAASMAEAVRLASRLAGPGDLVLLSPACASFDMYANFSARGDDFRQCVEALAA